MAYMNRRSAGPGGAREYEQGLRELVGCAECGSTIYREEWRTNGWEEYRVAVCENCGAVEPDK